jgi:thioredoxin 1
MSRKLVEVTDSEFEDQVIRSVEPVLVDFWAPRCPPCLVMGPIVEELALRLQGKIKVCKVNVDYNPTVADSYGIRSIPTLLVFKKGQVAARIVGLRSQEEIEKEVEAAIK